MKYLASSFLVLLITLLVAPVAAEAQYGQYGGQTPNGAIRLVKEVKDKKTDNYVKNLSVNDTLFQSGDIITYRITVTNTGNTSYGFVDVKDVLPSYLELVAAPGNYNTTSREITYRVDNLTPQKSDTREVKAKVVQPAQLPSQQGVFCVVNNVSLRTHDNATANDSSQACISNQPGKVLASSLPATGPLLTAAIIGGLLVGGGVMLGVTLRKAKH